MKPSTYRHPYATSIDLTLEQPLFLYANDDFISEEMISQIDNYQKQQKDSLLNYDISYDANAGQMFIGFVGRVKIDDLALNIMPLLNFCASINIYISSSAPYHMSWGDYESGAIYFYTDKTEESNKAIITGISCNGEVVVSTIPWKY